MLEFDKGYKWQCHCVIAKEKFENQFYPQRLIEFHSPFYNTSIKLQMKYKISLILIKSIIYNVYI